MASPDVLDFNLLLGALPGGNPTGENLRANRSPGSAYDRVKDARSAARSAERLAEAGGEEASKNRPDWRPVIELGARILAEQSKDLEVAAWMTEALVRQHGYAGLRNGFRLARELIERFWDGLYPLPDEDGMLTRVAPLTGLNGDDADGTLVAPIKSVRITEGRSAGPFTVVDYEQAASLEQIDDPEKRARRIEQGAVSMDLIEKAVADSSPDFYRGLLEDLTLCGDEYDKLCEILAEKCGSLAPPSSNIRNALEACREAVQGLSKRMLQAATVIDTAAVDNGAPAAAGATPAAAGVAIGAIRTRDDAFRTLLQVAEFFRRTEPHTPISYALEQAVRWGKMPLPQLMTELIPEESVRAQLFRLVGIPTAGDQKQP